MIKIKIKCISTTFQGVNNFQNEKVYYDLVKPIDYDFCLEVGQYYYLLGLITVSGTPWLYVTSCQELSEIRIIPAILFNIDWSLIPNNWCIRLIESTKQFEILPNKLAKISNWFEKYVDEDEKILQIVQELREELNNH